MAELKASKVVSSLPGTLDANTIYVVRVGTGFDLYVTNNSGTVVSYSLNQPVTSVAAGNASTALTLTLSNEQTKYGRQTLNANCAITLAGGSTGRHLVVSFQQDATGGRTLNWPTANVRWRGGTAPVMPTAASALLLVTVYHDGTDYLCTSTTF